MGVRVVTMSDIYFGAKYPFEMRKILAVLVVGALSLGVSPARADGPPAANVSCSLTDTGVRYGVSMVFTGSGISFSSLKYEWEYLVAGGDKNPTLVSSYGPRTAQSVTAANGLDLTYETLLALAKGDEKASVLMYASSVFSDGLSVLTNRTGSGCYVELPAVFKNKNEKAVVAAAKVAAQGQAAAQAAMDKGNIETILASLRVQSAGIDSLIEKYSATSPSMKANLTKMALSRPMIPVSIEPNFTYQNALDLEAKMNTFVKNFDSFYQRMLKSTPTTISCVKGKVTKKVTGVSPKCPAGYKIK